MKPNQVICLSKQNSQPQNTVTIETLYNFKLHILGASIPVSSPPDQYDQLNYLTAAITEPKEKVRDLLAIRIVEHDRKSSLEKFSGMLLVTVINDQHSIDLENVWTPSADRMGHIKDGAVVVLIDGLWYSSSQYEHERKDMAYVADPNLLCKYLAGRIDADEIKKAANPPKEEQMKNQIALLQSQVKALEAHNAGITAHDSAVREGLWSCAENLAKALRNVPFSRFFTETKTALELFKSFKKRNQRN